MKKKFCSLILALSMVLSFVPVVNVSAETTSGTCGDNLTWTLDDEGTLTISGNGYMDAYATKNPPWYNSKDNIRVVEISSGVNSIGYRAFSNCSNLTNVVVPNSIKTIDSYAFYGCSQLATIILPETLTRIGNHAFENTGYYNDETNWENDVLYIDKYLICARNSISGAYSIKENTYMVGDYAFFKCSELTNLTIPDSIQRIGTAAFAYCSNLTNVTIPNSVISLGSYAFEYCSNMTSITIPDSITSIGYRSFYNCGNLTNITLSNSITSIDEGAFENTGYYNDETNWENDVLYIDKYLICARNSISGAYSIKENTKLISFIAFYGCSGLKNITIPNSITNIGNRAFYGCADLTAIMYDGTEAQWNEVSIGTNTNITSDKLVFLRHTINFDPNGGTGEPEPQTKMYDIDLISVMGMHF